MENLAIEDNGIPLPEDLFRYPITEIEDFNDVMKCPICLKPTLCDSSTLLCGPVGSTCNTTIYINYAIIVYMLLSLIH